MYSVNIDTTFYTFFKFPQRLKTNAKRFNPCGFLFIPTYAITFSGQTDGVWRKRGIKGHYNLNP